MENVIGKARPEHTAPRKTGSAPPMSPQAIATTLLLPPLLLVLIALLGGLLAARRRPVVGIGIAVSCLLLLLLATPFVAGHLRASLEDGLPSPAGAPQAIVVLSGEVARAADHVEVGPLTLERMRAAAALHRRTGLPLLVTGGALGRGDPPVAALMARSFAEDFGVPVRWIEPGALDTRDNAELSAALLRREGIGTVHLVTHAWHMHRALDAFARTGLTAVPAVVRFDRVPDGQATDWIPRPDQLYVSWLALREWAGILVYRLRDGTAAGK